MTGRIICPLLPISRFATDLVECVRSTVYFQASMANRRINWSKLSLWAFVLLVITGGSIWGASYVMLRRTPEWYQPDTSTPEQRSKAARAFQDVLTSIYNWGGKHHAMAVRAKLSTNPSASESAQSAQAQALLAEKPDESFQISFTDTQLNAFFDTWENTHDRRAWFEKYVMDPRLVLRENQLILVGKVKESQMVISLVFEPKLTSDGKLDLNLTNVFGGVLPMPDAMWSGQRMSIENTLRSKLPTYQQGATISPEGVANGDAGSAAMNQMLLATLQYKPASAVIFVPLDVQHLSQSLPVKITAFSIHDHTLQMTAEQMSEDERETFLHGLKGEATLAPAP